MILGFWVAMLLQRLVVGDIGLCLNPQTTAQDIIHDVEEVKIVPKKPSVYWMALKDWATGLFPVFHPRKNGAKSLIVFLCMLHVILCSLFFLSPARTGILLLRLHINRNFGERVVEDIRDDSFHFKPIKPVESCRKLLLAYLFNFVFLRVLQHGFECCT